MKGLELLASYEIVLNKDTYDRKDGARWRDTILDIGVDMIEDRLKRWHHLLLGYGPDIGLRAAPQCYRRDNSTRPSVITRDRKVLHRILITGFDCFFDVAAVSGAITNPLRVVLGVRIDGGGRSDSREITDLEFNLL